MAVTKKRTPEDVALAVDAGLTCMGESRVQEAGQKIPLCGGQIEWHMIGHLQTNKARHAVVLFHTVHSLDSVKLLDALERECEREGKSIEAFVQVNVSGESSKHGLEPGQVDGLLQAAGRCIRITVVGLMTIAPFTTDCEDARPQFARLRELRDQLRDRTGFGLDDLSMGMTHDYIVAVEEGATSIRLGSALFGGREGA